MGRKLPVTTCKIYLFGGRNYASSMQPKKLYIIKDLAMELCKKLSEYDREIFKLIDINDVELALDIQINVICAKNLNTIT